MVKKGDHVIFIDEMKVEHNALVTNDFGADEHGGTPAVNVVYISGNKDEEDPYGRQIKRETSIVHCNDNSAHARCWK